MHPRLLALLTPDDIRTEVSGKRTVVGIGNATIVDSFPAQIRIPVYFMLADMSMSDSVIVRIVDPVTEDVLNDFSIALGHDGIWERAVVFSIDARGPTRFNIHMVVNDKSLGFTEYLIIANDDNLDRKIRDDIMQSAEMDGVNELDRTAVSIILAAKSRLKDAEMAVRDLWNCPDPERRIALYRNAITMSRSAAEVLRRLKSQEGYADWYAPWSAEMAADPLLKYVFDLRSKILHEGVDQVFPGVELDAVSSVVLPPPPPGALRPFLGDEIGGSGWIVRLEDGSTEKIYYRLPEASVTVGLYATGVPDSHLGVPLYDRSVQNIASLYVGYIARLVESAAKHFGP